MSALQSEITALRVEVSGLRQVLEGFAGAMGLVAQVSDNRSRISIMERHLERAKGAMSVIAIGWGIIAGAAASFLTSLWSR